MKIFVFGVLISVTLTTAIGCGMNSKLPSSDFDNILIESADGDNMNSNYKLIIKGNYISSIYCSCLNQEQMVVELPITTVMKELGIAVEWKDKSIVTFSFNEDCYVLDTSKSDFGLPRPPGSKHYVREVIDGEVVVDHISALGLIHWVGADININIDEKIVEIE